MKCPHCGHELPVRYQPKRERDEDIKQLYHRAKWEPDLLSEKYGIGIPRIKQIIGIENLRRDKKEWYARRRQSIYTDRESGMTFRALGQKYGICANRARDIYIVEKRRIEWRKRREAQRG